MRAYNDSVSWWGWHGSQSQPTPMSIVEILKSGSLSPRLAALFWIALERRASLIIASDPPMGGKTTTLTALLAFAPPEAVAYYTRGLGETFQMPPSSPEQPVYLLINEISDHLPVYTWSAHARRAFELLAQGYCLGSTMHADTVDEVIDILTAELRVPRQHVARLTFIATLLPFYKDGRLVRRAREVAFLRPGGDGEPELVAHNIATWHPETDTLHVLESPQDAAALADWAGLGLEEFLAALEQREQFLLGLMGQNVLGLPAVADAVRRYRDGA